MTTRASMVGCRMVPDLRTTWIRNRSFIPHGDNLVKTLAPKLRTISVVDADRVWTGTQNIGVIFSEAVSGDATGWSVTINGVAKTLTYVSGSGTQNWVMQIGAVVHHGEVIKLTYSVAAGATVSSSGGVAINGVTAVPLPDQLTKRVRFLLCDSMDALVVSQSVKAALFEYDSGVVANANWMVQANKATVATDAAGQFDMQYTGSALVGGSVYVAVADIPTTNVSGTAENMLVKDTVV